VGRQRDQMGKGGNERKQARRKTQESQEGAKGRGQGSDQKSP